MLRILASLICLISLNVMPIAATQDSRIYTRVYDAGAAENTRPAMIGGGSILIHRAEGDSDVIISILESKGISERR